MELKEDYFRTGQHFQQTKPQLFGVKFKASVHQIFVTILDIAVLNITQALISTCEQTAFIEVTSRVETPEQKIK